MKQSRHLHLCAALLLSVALLLSACGGGPAAAPAEDVQENVEANSRNSQLPASESPEKPEEPEDEEAAAIAAALEQYRTIAAQADTYEYSSETPTGVYLYALAPMQTSHGVPALLLKQETTFGIGYILVFQYDPVGKTVLQPDSTLMDGAGSAGGFRGSLFLAGDGNGLLSSSFYSGTGLGTTDRVTLDGDALLTVTLWEGNQVLDTDPVVEEIGVKEIPWRAVSDTSALDNWTPEAAFVPAAPGSDETPAAETELPTDGNRIVFRGIIDSFSYDEVVTLQGYPDPQADWSDRNAVYQLIILETPQTMSLVAGDGDGFSEMEVKLIDVTDCKEDLSQYYGQLHIFSIDPNQTYWPSDTRLPLMQPDTNNVHVLG